MKEIPGRVKNQGNRGLFFIYIFLYIIYWLIRYKKSHGVLAMVKTKPNIQNCNMCTCSGNRTQERGVQDLLCLVDLYLVYLI